MKKILQSMTLAFFLYLVPLLMCFENESLIAKSIEELNSITSSSKDKFINNEKIELKSFEKESITESDIKRKFDPFNFKQIDLKDESTMRNKNSNSIGYIEEKENLKDSELKELDEITNFLETSIKTESGLKIKKSNMTTKEKSNQSYDLYKIRKLKMRRKKEIIVKKVFEIFPLLGEILGIADVEKIHLIVNKFFLIRESDLLTKYITMWDSNVNFTQHSAKVLLNMLLCNSRFNKLRCILNLLMEGLCKGDPRSIRIFKEIVTTVVIDTILKTNFKYFNDVQAKFNLIRLFNVGFVFSPIIKVQFLEKMLISEKLKELVTFMILRLKSKEEIEIIMDNNLHSPLPPIINYNDTHIKHDERMITKFLYLKENLKIDNEINKNDDISEYYNLDNLLKDEKNDLRYDINTNNYQLNNDEKEDILNISSNQDPDSDVDLFSEELKKINQNQKINTNTEKIGSIRRIANNNYLNNNMLNPKNLNDNQIIVNESIKSYASIYKSLGNSKTLSRSDAEKILKHIKLENDLIENESVSLNLKIKNKELSEKYLSNDSDEINYIETQIIDPNHLPYSEKQKIKLSEIKDQIKNEYNNMLYNMTYQPMPELDEYIPHYQIGVNKRTIYPKYKKHLENLIRLNDLLDDLPINLPRGSIDVSSPNVKAAVEPIKPIVITKNFNGVNVSMQFREKDKDISKKDKKEIKSPEITVNSFNSDIKNSEFRFKSFMQGKSLSKLKTNISMKTTKEEDFANKSFNLLINSRYQGINPQSRNYNNQRENLKINQIEKNNIYNNQRNNNNNLSDITENITYNLPEIKNVVNGEDKNIKVLFPKEIHTTYQVQKHGMKTIEINTDNPTKKLILERLLPEDQFNDFMNQQEKPKEEIDPTGLYNVLKNIQNRKCSCGFLCIEIGAIYGDFSALVPQNITVPYNINRNVHFVIKPIVVLNNTAIPYNPPIPPIPPYNPNNGGNSTNFNNIFIQDEDCDDLKLLGVSSASSNSATSSANFNRFKETSSMGFGAENKLSMKNSANSNQYRMQGVNFNKIQRKFYRKVAIAEEIYSQDTFKQGLNVIILQRDRKYTKLYERTFDTNNSRKESDELAEILKDTPCSKIIVITGTGKWMGAMTPALIKEIKQIGGPDLNNLYSPDEDDNSMADHSFILIGRRGLCRYNGIFRIKNYDISRQMQRLFPDRSSDPNDCFFDDVSLENQKNKLSEKRFFHTIDLRLTLNINNDNRFAWDAPTISTVSPFRGSIHGGQEIKIGGFNFGSHTTDLKEILIGGVICGDFINLSPNLISCITRASTILGPGPKNVMVKLRNGYESPARTCNVFEYVGDPKEALDDLKSTIKTVHKMQNLPIYMNSNYHDQDISIFDHLKFNNRFYKAKLKPDHSNHVTLKLDNMVKANYNELIDVVNNESGLKPKMTGLRRKRFSSLMTNLENCDNDKK